MINYGDGTRPSFPNVVSDATDRWCRGLWVEGERLFLLAAALAPSNDQEADMLLAAWKCHARASGWISRLEIEDQ